MGNPASDSACFLRGMRDAPSHGPWKPRGEMAGRSPCISVVIPVFKAEGILPVLCSRLGEALAPLGSHEIILVDDRSPDGSWGVLEQLAGSSQNIIAVRFSRNFGQQYAITAGIDLARGDWVVVMDCDLQDRPEEIPRLLEKAREGYDVVLARRVKRCDSFAKRLVSRLYYRIFHLLSGVNMDASVGSFRIMSRPVVDAFSGMREAFRVFGGMIDWVGFRTGYLDVKHDPRYAGKSSYSLRKLIRLALDGIISFSNRPLYLSIGIGIAVSVFSGVYGAFFVLRSVLFGFVSVPGWLTTLTLQSFLGGLILTNLGILGIYIGRIYDEAKRRPLYIVDRIIAPAPGCSAESDDEPV